MADPSIGSDRGSLPSDVESLARCCASHSDWPTLTEHLLREYPQLEIRDLLREVSTAKTAVTNVGLDEEDALEVGELIARHQLLILTGARADGARLDPERHMRAG
jgi:hypothetical protein